MSQSSNPAGRRLGVVLTGAGVRGLGQAGTLGTLERAGLRPDVVVGVSTGAVVASIFAARVDWEAALQATDRSRLPTLAPTDPQADPFARLRGVLRSARQLAPSVWTWGRQGYETFARSTLTELLGSTTVEATRLPLALTATDLLAAERRVIRSGDLTTATLAASALPGVSDPIAADGGLLFDGTFSDPAPIDVARELGADVVVAVYPDRPLEDMELDSWLRGLVRGVEIGSRAFAEERLLAADLVIRPRIDTAVRTLDFSTLDNTARRCAVATRAVIPDVAELLGRA
ncbi:hypothetical protein ER308_20125 [Egibacter rhizosphaerae]|uniref:PNPLA domain-containing protein n=1 Tax=Egibacter rhizosphaerae TaxID=1670831 RepID=A0A411YKC5_9ACTN|nr:patatin-like phospholipase family protein [Egibacter rhizosphaerae]QBI21645.1 hypothetical protein ER308_20125 [Egibacter rhizosphaerae]